MEDWNNKVSNGIKFKSKQESKNKIPTEKGDTHRIDAYYLIIINSSTFVFTTHSDIFILYSF